MRGLCSLLSLRTFYNDLLTKRNISFSASLSLKRIVSFDDQNILTFKADIIESERKPHLVEVENKNVCHICASGLDIKHTDVLILSQYVRSDGCMLPKRITGLCNKQQRRLSSLVTMAQKAGLMPNLTPANSKKDPKKRYKWEKFNKYFDESTIKCK